MHTFKFGKEIINYNSDYSGNVIINNGEESIEVSAEILFAFTADMIRNKKINELENATTDEILISTNKKELCFLENQDSVPEKSSDTDFAKFINIASTIINYEKEIDNGLSLIECSLFSEDSKDYFGMKIKYHRLRDIPNLLNELNQNFALIFNINNTQNQLFFLDESWSCGIINSSYSIYITQNEIMFKILSDKEFFIKNIIDFIQNCFCGYKIDISILKQNEKDIDFGNLIANGIKAIDIDIIDGYTITKRLARNREYIYMYPTEIDDFIKSSMMYLSSEYNKPMNTHINIPNMKFWVKVCVNSSNDISPSIALKIKHFKKYFLAPILKEDKECTLLDSNVIISVTKKELLFGISSKSLYQQFATDILSTITSTFKHQDIIIKTSKIAKEYIDKPYLYASNAIKVQIEVNKGDKL